jgi:hypothetical protein
MVKMRSSCRRPVGDCGFRHLIHEGAKFGVVGGIGFLVTGKLASNVALFLGICLCTLFRFWSYRKWVWIAPTANQALDPAESSRDTKTPEPKRPGVLGAVGLRIHQRRAGPAASPDGLASSDTPTPGSLIAEAYVRRES